MYELGSMAKALDMQKDLAKEAHSIHFEVTRKNTHDPEVRLFHNYLYSNCRLI